MVTRGMGSQVGGSNTIGETQDHSRPDPISNPLTREGSLYNLTLDEVQNQFGDMGKPLGSMNLEELLKSVWTAEDHNQAMQGVDFGQSALQPGEPGSSFALNRESNLLLSTDLSKKTVDEVWQGIPQEQRSSLARKGTLGSMTLEDFLVKAGVVNESHQGKKLFGSVLGPIDPMGMPQQGQWMNYANPSIQAPPLQQQQHGILPVYAPGHPVQQPIPLNTNPVIDVTFPETQMAMASSPLMGALSDTQSPRRKRGPPEGIAEKSVERRQKRMIKNRESAARSRARKQAYTQELENKVSRLEEENERLKKLQELEKALPSIPIPEPRYQLRRTSSAPI